MENGATFYSSICNNYAPLQTNIIESLLKSHNARIFGKKVKKRKKNKTVQLNFKDNKTLSKKHI